MVTTNIGERDIAGLTIKAFVPKIIEEIGCLQKQIKTKCMLKLRFKKSNAVELL